MFTDETKRIAVKLLELYDDDFFEILSKYSELDEVEVLQVLIAQGFLEPEDIEELDFER